MVIITLRSYVIEKREIKILFIYIALTVAWMEIKGYVQLCEIIGFVRRWLMDGREVCIQKLNEFCRRYRLLRRGRNFKHLVWDQASCPADKK